MTGHAQDAGGVIAATKLQVPPRRAELVPRHALVTVLAGAAHTRVTLLSAPAGSGKTTLLQQWHLAAAGAPPFAWLSLDEGDDDPVRFWTSVIAALRAVVPGVGERAEGALRSPGAGLDDVVVPLLVNELTQRGERIVLVLDDLHAVADPAIHRSLGTLVERLPPTLHAAVATRTEPPWPSLPRLRARDQVVELGADELRFSDAEAAAYLSALGLALAPEQVARIRERTEGWAAGLQLAAISLRGHGPHDEFLAAFAGDSRRVGDYLAAEVLERVAPELRRFLLRTSILGRLCPELCDAVTGESRSGSRLAELERRNLFVVPLDSRRRWYRYHHLFAELLRRRLADEEPEAVSDLHRRAAAWLAASGDVAAAIEHAIAGRDADVAAALVASHWLGFFNQGWLTTVQRWLDALAPETVHGDDQLWLARAWTLLDRGRLEEIAPWLRTATERGERAAWADVLGALHRFKLGDVGAGAHAAGEAVRAHRGGGAFWRTVAGCATGVTAYWRGRYDDANAALCAAARTAAADGNGLAHQYAVGYMALDAAERAGPQAALRLLDELDAAGGRPARLGEHFTAMMVHLARGRAAELEGRPDAAERDLARSVELARRGAGTIEEAAASLAHARVLAALGRDDDAERAFAAAHELVAACADPGVLGPTLAAAEPTAAPGGARVSRTFAAAASRPPGAQRAPAAAGDQLSERELRVLALLRSDLSLREIGGELYLSHNTIKTHTRNIYLKLDARSREEAVGRGRELGLL